MEQSHKAHRARQSGPSSKKKEITDKKKRGLSGDRHNPKVGSVAIICDSVPPSKGHHRGSFSSVNIVTLSKP